MKKIFLLFALLFAGLVNAQYIVTINAQLANEETRKPVEFANISFIDKNLGTVSNTKGRFYLKFDEERIGEDGVLEISALGYKTMNVTLGELYDMLENSNTIFVSPSPDVQIEGITRSRVANGEIIKGKVRSTIGPVQGAIVAVKGTFYEAITNVDGEYSIDANEGDVLVFSHLGMIPVERVIGGSNTISVKLDVDGEILDEVYLKGEKRTEFGNTRIETAYGKKDFDKLGFTAYQINSDRILPSYNNLDQVMVKLTGIQVNGIPPDRTYAFTRSVGTSVTQNTLPVIVIDEIPYPQGPNLQLPAIDVQSISSVTAIPGVVGTVRYGTLARAGAIIIRTKGYELAQSGVDVTQVNSPLVRGNNFSENLPAYNKERVMPAYISELRSAQSSREAKSIYDSHKEEKAEYGIPYFINASEAMKQWSQKNATRILEEIAEIAPNNVRALKSSAYRLEEMGEMDKALNIYQRIAMLQPQASQSYRDLAHVYKETGEITKAFGLYKQILANQTPGIDFSGMRNIAQHELQQLIMNHKRKVDYQDLPNDLLDASFKKDVRVVLEWNDPTAEFEVQFVNPRRKFFTWKHDTFSNKERLLAEVKQGYASEEFIIDDSERGTWQVNIQYLGDEIPSVNPTFLKYTLYKNYGMPSETKEVKTVKLYQYQDKVILDQFVN